jgi:hypothetical protein
MYVAVRVVCLIGPMIGDRRMNTNYCGITVRNTSSALCTVKQNSPARHSRNDTKLCNRDVWWAGPAAASNEIQ